MDRIYPRYLDDNFTEHLSLTHLSYQINAVERRIQYDDSISYLITASTIIRVTYGPEFPSS